MPDLQRMLGVKSYSAVMRAVIRGDVSRPQKGAYRLYWLEEDSLRRTLEAKDRLSVLPEDILGLVDHDVPVQTCNVPVLEHPAHVAHGVDARERRPRRCRRGSCAAPGTGRRDGGRLAAAGAADHRDQRVRPDPGREVGDPMVAPEE